MPSPLAFLAGFGQGAANLGQDLETQQLLHQQRLRQLAQDAMTSLATTSKLGMTPVPQGTDPNALLASLSNANNLRSGGAIPNSALGIPEESVPNAFGRPSITSLPTDTGGMQSYIMDPSKTPEALQEKRLSMQQMAIDRRAREAQDAAQAREDAKEKAALDRQTQAENTKTLAAQKAAKADYATLKATNPKHPLVQQPFDPDEAANYGAALKFEQEKQLQASAYHPPPAQWENSGTVDKITGEPIYINKATLERRTLSGAMPKPASGGGGAGQGAQTSLPDLLRTHLALTQDEHDPNFKPSFTQQMREGANYGLRQDQIKGTVPSLGQAILGFGLNATTSPDENQVAYMQNGRSWGEDASNAWKGRTNEERVIRDINTGTLNASNANMPKVRAQLQERRENVIAMTAIANPQQFAALDPQRKAVIQSYIDHLPPEKRTAAQEASKQALGAPAAPSGSIDLRGGGTVASGAGTGTDATSQLRALWDQSVAKHGKDVTLHELGPRP